MMRRNDMKKKGRKGMSLFGSLLYIIFGLLLLIHNNNIVIVNGLYIRQVNQRLLSSKSSKRSFNYSLAHWHDDIKGKSGDEYGEAVAIQNNVALVAAPLESDYPIYEVHDGKVFIFIDKYETNEWESIRTVAGEDSTEFFGSAVALHYNKGNYFAVVGAPRNNRYGQFSGGAYYFNVETDPNKDQEYPTHLVQKERHGGAFFGCSVAISSVNGHVRVAIGASGHRQRGAVFVYTRAKDGSLVNEEILYGSVSHVGGQFGYAIAFNENLIAVGAPVVKHGMVFIYSPTESGNFEQIKYMSAPASLPDDVTNDDESTSAVYYYFGGSVAIGNGYLFIGSPLNNLRGQNSGTVYVYDLSDIYNPNFVQSLFASMSDTPGQEFGWSLSFDTVNTKLLVGSCNRESTTVTGSKAYVFIQKGEGYFLEATLQVNKFSSDRTTVEVRDILFGKSVGIYGDYAVVGAPFGHGEKYHSGDVYFFKAQTKEEFYSTGSDGNSVMNVFGFGSSGAQFAIFGGIFIIALYVMYRRYKINGEEEGLGNLLSSGCVTDDGDDFSFEDSEHSSHPMIVRSSKEGKKKSKKSKSSTKGKKTGKAGSNASYTSVKNDDL